jgi:mRNA-degrading endonuclease RelE of RelBE toxin-antitoxin system
MDKIQKFLAKLSAKERELVAVLIKRAICGQLNGLDVKKLKGFKGLYRIREGKIRVVFEKSVLGKKVVNVDFRGRVYVGL